MAGKWAKMKDQLVKFQQPMDFQAKVNEKKSKMTDCANDKVKLAMAYLSVKGRKDALEEEIKALNVDLEAYSQMLLERLEDEEIDSFRTEDGITIFIKNDIYVSVKDKEQFHAWVKDQGLEDLFTVNYQTMAGVAKTRLESGEDLPPGCEAFFKSSIQKRAAKTVQ